MRNRKLKIFIILFLLVLPILIICRIPKLNIKNFRLKDGSIIKGVVAHDEVYSDTLVIQNEYIGYIKIPKNGLRYRGTNYNAGFMISYSPFLVGEKNRAFDKGSLYSLTTGKASDENLTTCFDLDYFYRDFDKTSTRYLSLVKMEDQGYYQDEIVNSTIDTGFYRYSAHFAMPAITLRLSIIPSFLQETIKQYNIFPYFGAGIGYNLAFIKYTRLTQDPIIINGDEFTNENIEYQSHFYGGMLYKALIGLSVKISTRYVLNVEIKYYKAKFTQFLTDEEKDAGLAKEQFNLSGMCPSFGIRFGFF